MLREVSIVLSKENKNYRRIAQKHYGLSDEQMKGKHVHHNPPKSEGGRDILEHLYVYSAEVHELVHGGDGFIGCAKIGAKRAHKNKDENGKSLTAVKAGKSAHLKRDENGKSIHAKNTIHGPQVDRSKRISKTNRTRHAKNRNEEGKSLLTLEHNKKLHSKKDCDGKSIHAQYMGKKGGANTPRKPTVVYHVESQKTTIFESLREASRVTGLSRSYLLLLIRGEKEVIKGYRAWYLVSSA